MALAQVHVPSQHGFALYSCPEHAKTNSLSTMKPLSESLFPSSDGRPGRGQLEVVIPAHTGQVTGLMKLGGKILRKASRAPATQRANPKNWGPGFTPATLVTFLAESDPVRRTKVIIKNGVKSKKDGPTAQKRKIGVVEGTSPSQKGKLMVFAVGEIRVMITDPKINLQRSFSCAGHNK